MRPRGPLWLVPVALFPPTGTNCGSGSMVRTLSGSLGPFPNQERLLSRGGINIQVDQNAIWGLAVELWWMGEAPSLHVREGSRIVPFTDEHIDRGARFLVGLGWPGLATPYQLPNGQGAAFDGIMRHLKEFERLGLPADVDDCG